MAYFVSDAMYNNYEENYLEHYGKKGMKWGKHIYGQDTNSSGYSVGRKKPNRKAVIRNERDTEQAMSKNPGAGLRVETHSLKGSTEKYAKKATKASRQGDVFNTMSYTAKYLNTSDQLRAQAKSDAEKYTKKASRVEAKQQKRISKAKDLSQRLERKKEKLILKAANNTRVQKEAELSIQKNIETLTKAGYAVNTSSTKRGVRDARQNAVKAVGGTAAYLVLAERTGAAVTAAALGVPLAPVSVGALAVAGVIGGTAGLIAIHHSRKQVSGTAYSISRDNVTAA